MTDFRLQVFKTVAERLSFTRAAEELCISQPAVTKHIRELEKQIGGALFVRSSGRIALTEKGELLLKHAREILASYRSMSEAFAETDVSFAGTLRIGASTTVSQYVLPECLARFKKLYPRIRITVFNGNTEQIEAWVASGDVDLGVIEGDATHPSLHYTLFRRDEIVLVTTANNIRFPKEEIALSELVGLPLVLRENGSGTLSVVEHALSAKGIARNALQAEIRLGSTEGIKRYLYSAGIFAFLSIAAVSDELASGRLRVVEIEGVRIDRSFRFAVLHGECNRLGALFVSFCRDRNR